MISINSIGQISRLVEGHITKYGLPLEHSAQCTVLLKFGSLNVDELTSFVNSIEDVLFRCTARREGAVIYKQDEVQVLINAQLIQINMLYITGALLR
jgi:hypothetical protein